MMSGQALSNHQGLHVIDHSLHGQTMVFSEITFVQSVALFLVYADTCSASATSSFNVSWVYLVKVKILLTGYTEALFCPMIKHCRGSLMRACLQSNLKSGVLKVARLCHELVIRTPWGCRETKFCQRNLEPSYGPSC
jgi:hypothetical protein